MNHDVIDFWFGTDRTFRPEWFTGSKDLDDQVTSRFASRLDDALDQAPSSPHDRLALIILFDQFPRHIHRNGPKSFHYDGIASRLVKEAPLFESCEPFDMFEAYFYMLPLEHSEDVDDQHAFMSFIDLLSRTYGAKGQWFVNKAHEIAVRHRDIIERFGRFPHRNGILRRASTEEELEFLSQPNSRF